MAEIRKIIFIKNAVETLGYFSEQIARELERNGYETCFIDYERMYESMDVMLHFLDREETALVTFNFIGLRGEAVLYKRQVSDGERTQYLAGGESSDFEYFGGSSALLSQLPEGSRGADAGILCGQRARRLCEAVLPGGEGGVPAAGGQ